MDESDTTDDLLVAALATGRSVAAAAEKVGVSERTARRRMADPAFRRRVDDLRAEVVAEALSVLNQSMSRAAEQLRELLESADEKVRLRAAGEIIRLGLAGHEVTGLRRELAELLDRAQVLAARKR
jgi:hypothetical protein